MKGTNLKIILQRNTAGFFLCASKNKSIIFETKQDWTKMEVIVLYSFMHAFISFTILVSQNIHK